MKKTKIALALLINSVVGIQAGQATTTISCPTLLTQSQMSGSTHLRISGATTGGTPVTLYGVISKKVSATNISNVMLVPGDKTPIVMQCYYNNNEFFIQNYSSQFSNCTVSGNSSIVCPD